MWTHYALTDLLTYLLTVWNRVLLEKLPGSQLVKKFLAFYGTWKFITAFISARHLSLSSASLSHITLPEDASYYYHPPNYAWVSQMVSFLQVSPPTPCICLSSPPHAQHVPSNSFFSTWPLERYLVRSTDYWAPHWVVFFFPLPCYLVPLRPKCSLQHPII